jgi:NAD-dependent SIR2 family protein deacetylase
MKTAQDLIEHLKKYKDAVIIVGSGVNQLFKDYSAEDFNDNYNRKNLKRNPDELWKFYNQNILTPIDNNNMYSLIEKLDYALLVNQNINGPTTEKTFDIHGNVGTYMCPKCKTVYSSTSVYDGENLYNECEVCGTTIRPTVLLAGERYDQTKFDDLKEKLIEAHTLILIGMDYTEEPLLQLIAQYGDIKIQVNAAGDPENQKALVAIQSKEQEFDPNELTFCEFLVKDDIENALERLIKIY